MPDCNSSAWFIHLVCILYTHFMTTSIQLIMKHIWTTVKLVINRHDQNLTKWKYTQLTIITIDIVFVWYRHILNVVNIEKNIVIMLCLAFCRESKWQSSNFGYFFFCLSPNEHFFRYIMTRTRYIQSDSIR